MRSRKLAIGGLALAILAAGIGVWGLVFRVGEASGVPVVMYRTTGCVCCEGWKKHMQAHGFRVETVATDRLYEVKAERGVPRELVSCHTAIAQGRVIEGHVPAEAVRWMLEDPDGPHGIAVPGMPEGSPGMSGLLEPFDVVAFEAGRAASVYAAYGMGGSVATERPSPARQ